MVMLVRFIAHAGIAIEVANEQLLIDPWFTDSTLQRPLLEPIIPGRSTIDFQIPPARESIDGYRPETILVSHFHAHHAPHDDILRLAAQTPSIIFGHPDIEDKNESVQEVFQDLPSTKAIAFRDAMTFATKNLTIEALSHTILSHTAWLISSEKSRILHIADSRLNKDKKLREPDSVWKKFTDLRPDILFINAGGNILRQDSAEGRFLEESSGLSPAEAAQITALIKPRVVSIIGCYNHSIWRNRREFIRSAPQIEEEFYWALSWLLPNTKFIPARPSHTYGIGDESFAGKVDTLLL